MRFQKALGKRCEYGEQAYLNPDSHKDHFSDDAFGNMQRWFAILTRFFISLCAIDGDETWSAQKASGAEDNINSIVARIMLKFGKLQEAGMIGGEDVEKLQCSLRAISPIAKMMKKPDKEQKGYANRFGAKSGGKGIVKSKSPRGREIRIFLGAQLRNRSTRFSQWFLRHSCNRPDG